MNFAPEDLDVTETTRQRVLKASLALGYRPSWRARAFARGRTHVIGLIYRPTSPAFAGPQWHRMLVPLTEGAHDRGYDIQFVPVLRASDKWREMLMDQRLDGCVVAHDIWPAVADVIKETQLPTVLLNAQYEGLVSVVPDDRDGASQITRHLLKLGHRCIAFVDNVPDSKHFSLRDRRAGFQEAMADAGLQDFTTILSLDEVAQIVQQLKAKRPAPTAVIAYNDSIAMPLMNEFWRQNIRVPQDVSVATFNDVPFARYCVPPLTTVDIPSEELVKQALAILLNQIESSSGETHLPSRLVIPEKLIIRESTTPPVNP